MYDWNVFVTSVTEILPGIYLGNQHSSEDQVVLDKVNVIINCTKHIKFSSASGQHFCVRIPLNDPGSQNLHHTQYDQQIMLRALPRVLKILSYCHERHIKVLIHCHAGAQRSAAVVLAWLMLNTPGSNNQTKFNYWVDYLVKKRPAAFYGGRSINFKAAIEHHFNLD